MHNRILIVDDSRLFRAMLRDALCDEDAEIIDAPDGESALQLVSTSPPDLILLDINMPGLSGLEVLKTLRAREDTRNISVIMVTANSDDEDVAVSLKLGASDYIVKPFSDEIVRARVRAAMHRTALFEEKMTLLQEKHELLKNLRAAESYHAALLDCLPDGIITTTESGQIERFSLSAQRIFGHSLGNVVGKNLDVLLSNSEDNELHVGTTKRHVDVTSSANRQCELEGLRSDGSTFPLEFTVREMWDDDGFSYICYARDLTEIRQREKVLKDAKQTAEAASQSKSEFLANMSHELRTPLTAILGFGETLLSSDTPETISAEHTDAAQTIIRNGEHLLALINSILDLSKIEAGKMEVQRIPCSPFQLLEDVSSLLKVRAETKKISLEVEQDGPLPETMRSDPLRLRQVLINLVGNAIKFTENGSVRIVSRFIQPIDGRPALQVDIIDSGIGMSTKQITGLFKPFAQADTSVTRRFGGTGLGLAISKRFAEMLGGDITVTSTFGEGSTFTVTVETGRLDGVPMLDKPPVTESSRPTPNDNIARMATNARLDCRVLLAEDGPDNQRLISFILKKAGADVTVVENGQLAIDAVLAATNDPYDVILMDMQMPVLDGYSAARNLRTEHAYRKPIIALTAHAMEGDREKCLSAGCDDYTTKPIDREKLVRLVYQYAHPEKELVPS